MTKSSLISSLSNPVPKPKPPPPVSALERFVHYLHPLLQSHPGSVAPSITLPQLRVIAQTNFHQLIALSLSVHFNPRRPYEGHVGKEEKLIICKNGWNALRNFISSEREKVWRAEMTGLSVREQRVYKKRRKEEKKVANAAIREGRMAKFIDIANEYAINYAQFVKLGDEHSGRLRFRQIKKEQKDAAANALVNSSALISASNVNAAISSVLPSPRPTPASYTLAHVVDERTVNTNPDAQRTINMNMEAQQTAAAAAAHGMADVSSFSSSSPSPSTSFSSSSSSSSSSPAPVATQSVGALTLPAASAAASSYFSKPAFSPVRQWNVEVEVKGHTVIGTQQPVLSDDSDDGKDDLQPLQPLQPPTPDNGVGDKPALWGFADVNGDAGGDAAEEPATKRLRLEPPAVELHGSSSAVDWSAALNGQQHALASSGNDTSMAPVAADAPVPSYPPLFQ